MNSTATRPWYQFSLRGLALLVLGLCVGLALGLAYSPFRKMAPNEAFAYKMPDYVIEPPDVLSIKIRYPQQIDANFDDECLVGPDGKIYVDRIGGLYITGLTLWEAQRALAGKAASIDPEATVELSIASYNSKKYYVVTKLNGGDAIETAPITGNETVLDAIAQMGGVAKPNGHNIWISRPSSQGTTANRILQVDYEQITSGANPLSNYQLLPGDRLFIEAKPMAEPAKQ